MMEHDDVDDSELISGHIGEHELRDDHWWEVEVGATTSFMRTTSVSQPPMPPPAQQITREQLMRIGVVMLAYSLYYTLLSGNLTVASLAAEELGPDRFATIPLVALFIGALLCVIPAAYIMGRYGRRAGFVIGGFTAIVAGIVAYVALEIHSFGLFVVSGLFLGVFDGFSDYLRFAAAEAVATSFQGFAVSMALCGGAICSVLGPELARIATETKDGSNKSGFKLYFLMATLVAVVFMVTCCCIPSQPNPNTTHGAPRGSTKEDEVISQLHASEDSNSRPSSPTVRVDAIRKRSLWQIATTRECFAATVAGMCAQWCMVLLMTGLPLAMVGIYDYSFQRYAFTIQIHLLGMFVPGLVTGIIVDKIGVVVVLVSGVFLFAASIFVGLLGHKFWHFVTCLLLLGVGWNFLSIGSTKLLLISHTESETSQTQAFFEFFSFVANGSGCFAAAFMVHSGGWHGVLWAAVPISAFALLVVFVLMLSPPRNHRKGLSVVGYVQGYEPMLQQ